MVRIIPPMASQGGSVGHIDHHRRWRGDAAGTVKNAAAKNKIEELATAKVDNQLEVKASK